VWRCDGVTLRTKNHTLCPSPQELHNAAKLPKFSPIGLINEIKKENLLFFSLIARQPLKSTQPKALQEVTRYGGARTRFQNYF
jgi:hypothetical protein